LLTSCRTTANVSLTSFKIGFTEAITKMTSAAKDSAKIRAAMYKIIIKFTHLFCFYTCSLTVCPINGFLAVHEVTFNIEHYLHIRRLSITFTIYLFKVKVDKLKLFFPIYPAIQNAVINIVN